MIPDDSPESITIAPALTLRLILSNTKDSWPYAAAKSVKPTNVFYTFFDPGLFSTCFFILRQGRLILFDEGI